MSLFDMPGDKCIAVPFELKLFLKYDAFSNALCCVDDQSVR